VEEEELVLPIPWRVRVVRRRDRVAIADATIPPVNNNLAASLSAHNLFCPLLGFALRWMVRARSACAGLGYIPATTFAGNNMTPVLAHRANSLQMNVIPIVALKADRVTGSTALEPPLGFAGFSRTTSQLPSRAKARAKVGPQTRSFANAKAPSPGALLVAGAGFEPATSSGLCALRFARQRTLA
jgi:hypothetical protein